MSNNQFKKNMGNSKVVIAWCGAEPTLICQERGGEKIDILPGESISVSIQMAEIYCKNSKFLLNPTDEEISEVTKKSEENRDAILKRCKKKAKALKARRKSIMARKAGLDVEDLEDIDEGVEDTKQEGDKTIEEMNKKDCKLYLDGRGVQYTSSAKIAELRELVQNEASKELHENDKSEEEEEEEETEEETETEEEEEEEETEEETETEEEEREA